MRKLLSLVVVSIVLLSGFVAWNAIAFLYGSKSKNEIHFELPKGRTFNQVARELKEKSVITNDRYFYFLARLLDKTTKIRVGEYLIPEGSTPQEVLDILVSGKSIEYPITIQEGLNMYEIANLLAEKGFYSAKEFLEVCRDKNLIRELLAENIDSLEGYLFPDTYKVTRFTEVDELVRAMVVNFLAVYKDLVMNHPVKMKRHEVVTLASIVEKETGAPDNRTIISSVFHNRLQKKMRLQSDPTILYGILDKTGTPKNNITRQDIKSYTKYNTYRVNGLPYGPISNPGEAALRATMRPDQTSFLYFVSRNDGTTEFTSNLIDHNKAVRQYQILRSGREGKSWRDLHKKNN